jgi:hypothetical protein
MVRYLIVLIAALTIMACSPASVTHGKSTMMRPSALVSTNTHEASEAATMEFLLRSAAADFHAHPPAKTLHFYNVRLGYILTSDGQMKYMLCGEFFSTHDIDHGERAFFMTIDAQGGPNGYDQFLGGQEISFCSKSSVTWSNAGDLSSTLQSRFDSL